METKPSFAEWTKILLDGYRHSIELLVANIGITVNVESAYQAYADALDNPSKFYIARAAARWYERGGIVGWWRHKVYSRLWPERYAMYKKLCGFAHAMMRQAYMNAVLETGKETL